MKNIILIITGLILGVLEITIFFTISHISIHIFLASIVGVSLIISGRERQGAVILLVAACIAELFSPFRSGLYILSTVLLLGVLHGIVSRQSVEVTHPVVIIGVYIMSFILLNIIQFIFAPLWIAYAITIGLNALLGLGFSYVMSIYTPRIKNDVRIGDNVHFR